VIQRHTIEEMTFPYTWVLNELCLDRLRITDWLNHCTHVPHIDSLTVECDTSSDCQADVLTLGDIHIFHSVTRRRSKHKIWRKTDYSRSHVTYRSSCSITLTHSFAKILGALENYKHDHKHDYTYNMLNILCAMEVDRLFLVDLIQLYLELQSGPRIQECVIHSLLKIPPGKCDRVILKRRISNDLLAPDENYAHRAAVACRQ